MQRIGAANATRATSFSLDAVPGSFAMRRPVATISTGAGLVIAFVLAQVSSGAVSLQRLETCAPAAPASGGYGTGLVGKEFVFLSFPADGSSTADWSATGEPPGTAVRVVNGNVLLSGIPTKAGSYTTRLKFETSGCPTATDGPYYFTVQGASTPSTESSEERRFRAKMGLLEARENAADEDLRLFGLLLHKPVSKADVERALEEDRQVEAAAKAALHLVPSSGPSAADTAILSKIHGDLEEAVATVTGSGMAMTVPQLDAARERLDAAAKLTEQVM